MTLDGLREELAPRYLELGREVERQIADGTFHAGTSATVQVWPSKPRMAMSRP